MVTIPQALQPKLMTPGAITVAQQKDIKRYGSLQAAEQARFKEKVSRMKVKQESKLQQEIQKAKQEITATGAYGYSNVEIWRKKSITEGANARIAELQKLLKDVQEGKVYADINKVVKDIQSYSDQIRYNRFIIERAKGKAEIAQRKRYEKKQERKKEIKKLREQLAKQEIKPETQPGITQQVKETLIQPGQPVYLEITEEGLDESKIYTSPTKEGPVLTPEQVKIVKSDLEKLEQMQQIQKDISTPIIPIGTQVPTFEKPKESFMLELKDGQVRVVPKLESKITKPETFQPSEAFLGSKEITTTKQPWLGTTIDYQSQGIAGLKPQERIAVDVGEIKPDYKTPVSEKIVGAIPGTAGILLTQVSKPVYLGSKEEEDKMLKLIKDPSPLAAKKLAKFLEDQQVKLKKDIGEYNELLIKSQYQKLTPEETIKLRRIKGKIDTGQVGTLDDYLFRIAEKQKRQGKEISIYGVEVDPVTGLRIAKGAATFAKTVSTVLAFEAGLAVAGSAIGTTQIGSTILGGKIIQKVGKAGKYVTNIAGLTVTGAEAKREYERRGDIFSAIAVGTGAAAGFFGTVYRKPILEKGIQVGKAVERKLGIIPKQVPSKYLFGGAVAQAQQAGLTNAQINQAIAYAKKKGISLQQAIKELFGISTESAARIIKEIKATEFREFIIKETSDKKVISFIKKGINDILKSKDLTQTEKALRIKNLLREVDQLRPRLGIGTQLDAIQRAQAQAQTFTITDNFASPIIKEQQALKQIEKIITEGGTAIAALLKRDQKFKKRFVTALAIGTVTDLQTKIQQETATETETITDTISGSVTGTITDTVTDTATETAIETIYRVPTLPTTPITITPTITVPTRPTRPGRPSRPIKPTQPPRIIDIDFKRKKKQEELVVAYKAEVLTPKGFQKVTDKPYTKKGARDYMARLLDNTKAATGRTAKLKKKVPQSKIKKGDGYYNQNQNKFRGFKIVKGKQIPLKNTWIEKKGFRNDTIGEQQGLTVAQELARRRKRATGLPVRRTKKRRTPFGF